MSQKNPLAYTGLVSASTTVQGDAQFNPNEFTVVDGVVSLSGGGMAVDSLAGDTGTATPTGAGVITVAGGTNLTSSATSHTLTMNMDAAISLATSVTSPIYTTSAADMNINAASAKDIIMKMGDASGANKVIYKDSASVEVASLNSDGGLSVAALTSAGTASINSSVNSNTSINTGTSTGTVSIGNSLAGAITADTSAGISLDGATASNFTITGAADLTLSSSAGSVVVSGGEAVVDAIQLTASNGAGGITMSAGTGGVNVAGNLNLTSVATKISMNGGAVTDFIGQATLTNGTVTVANTNIAATDRIIVTRTAKNASTAYGTFEVVITAATNFIITSCKSDTTTETNDASTVDYVIFRQT